MERRYRLRRARWRFGLVFISLLLTLAGLMMLLLAWPEHAAESSEGFAASLFKAGTWLGFAGIACSGMALFLCKHWHRHSVACGGAMAGAFAGAVVFSVSLIFLITAGI